MAVWLLMAIVAMANVCGRGSAAHPRRLISEANGLMASKYRISLAIIY